jgi:hypothetical protein
VWALRVTFGLFWGGLAFAAGAFAFSYFGWHINPSFVLYLSVCVTCFFTIVSKVIMPN